MPLYTFTHGEHSFDRIVPVGTTSASCHCGDEARRAFDLTGAKGGGKYASEFELSSAMRDLRDEATHYKQVALREKHEAEMNGFRAHPLRDK